MIAHSSPVFNRRAEYPDISNPDLFDGACIPVSDSILSHVSCSRNVPERRLRESIIQHQRNLWADDAGVLSATYDWILNGDASVVSYTDTVLYLNISRERWDLECSWAGWSSSEAAAVRDCYDAEIGAVSELATSDSGPAMDSSVTEWVGFPVLTGFPLRGVAECPRVASEMSAFQVGADAEFLRTQVGLSWDVSVAYAVFDSVSAELDSAVSMRVCSSIVERPVECVRRDVERVQQLRKRLYREFSALSDAGGGGRVSESAVFGRVASLGGVSDFVV